MKHLLNSIKPTTWITLLGLIAVAGYMLLPESASAQGIGEAGDNSLKGFLYVVVLQLTGWLLYVGGTLLDYGVNTFVLNFGTIFNSGGVGVAINELWVLVRDLFNILFIFGLVYIGFKMILNSDDSQTRKTLVSLIIAALLINFSLFITKFVVDFTNILASEVATAAFAGPDPFATPGTDSNVERRVEVGNTFFRLMGITSFIGDTPELRNGTMAPWSFIFGIGIINIIGAFAFGVGGIMLVIRFIALSVYMVLSPFMFLGWIFPGFQGMSQQYWSGFLKQAFYAPVYIIMIFFAASIIENFFGAGGSAQGGGIGTITNQNNSIFAPQNGASVSEAAANFAGGLGPFILSAGFLIAAVQVAGKLAADGSGIMTKVSNGVNSRLRGAVRRPLAAYGAVGGYAARGVGRGVGGSAARYVNQGAETRRRQLNNVAANWAQKGPLGQAAARTLDRTAVAGYDRLANAQILGSETAKQQRERIASQQQKFNTTGKANERRSAIEEARAELEKIKKDNSLTSADKKAKVKEQKNKIKKATKKMSDEELLDLEPAVLNTNEVLGQLTSAQLKTLAGSGKFNNNEIKALGANRETAIFGEFEKVLKDSQSSSADLEEAMKDLATTISTMSNEEVSALSPERLQSQAIAVQLSEKQLDAVRDSGNLTAAEFGTVKDKRKEGLTNIAKVGFVEVDGRRAGPETKELADKQRKNLVKGGTQDAGKLPVEVFEQPDMYQFITPQMLSQRIRNGDVSDTQRTSIEYAVKTYLASGDPGADRAQKAWKKWQEGSDVNSGGFKFD